MQYFVSVFIKFFFLLTPFFVLSVFLSLTSDMASKERRQLALRITWAVWLVAMVLYFFGRVIFDVFGITLDAFRIGAGSLLFLSAVALIRTGPGPVPEGEGDISVVPLAIPITVGPATIGALLVLGASQSSLTERLVGCAALTAAVTAVGVILLLAASLERILGKNGISILTKLTGLVLSALAAQIVFTGIKNFLG